MSVQSPTSTYAVDVQEIKEDLAQLIQWMRERQVCERPYKYLSQFARRLRFIENTEFGYLIEDAVDQLRLSELEAEELKWLDVVVYGQDREQRTELYLACEVSSAVSDYDLARAIRRGALLQKATGVKTMPVILGKAISEPLRKQADAMQAGWVLLPD